MVLCSPSAVKRRLLSQPHNLKNIKFMQTLICRIEPSGCGLPLSCMPETYQFLYQLIYFIPQHDHCGIEVALDLRLTHPKWIHSAHVMILMSQGPAIIPLNICLFSFYARYCHHPLSSVVIIVRDADWLWTLSLPRLILQGYKTSRQCGKTLSQRFFLVEVL